MRCLLTKIQLGVGGSYTVSFEKICRQNRILTIAREKNKPVKIFTKLKANLSNGIVWKIFVRLHNCKDKNAEDRDKKNKIKDRYISQHTLYCTVYIYHKHPHGTYCTVMQLRADTVLTIP